MINSKWFFAILRASGLLIVRVKSNQLLTIWLIASKFFELGSHWQDFIEYSSATWETKQNKMLLRLKMILDEERKKKKKRKTFNGTNISKIVNDS